MNVETRDHVHARWIALNRPERGNAMVPEMMRELAEEIRRAEADDCRALVLSGTGASFCVGADLKWVASHEDPAEAIATLVRAHHAVIRALADARLATIAAVNGPAAGGGLSLALATDYRVASMGATITAAYFRLGLPPDGGNSVFLTRMLGVGRAMELLAGNRTLRAPEAQAWGLVADVVPAGALEREALARAEALALVPIATLRAARELLSTGFSEPLERQLLEEERAMTAAARSASFKVALRAFLERPR